MARPRRTASTVADVVTRDETPHLPSATAVGLAGAAGYVGTAADGGRPTPGYFVASSPPIPPTARRSSVVCAPTATPADLRDARAVAATALLIFEHDGTRPATVRVPVADPDGESLGAIRASPT